MRKFLIAIMATFILLSCHKTTTLQPLKPKLGTKWVYRLKKFNAAGILQTTTNLTYTISAEQTMGSDKWFVVTDSTGAAVFMLNQKPDGLYQFQNAAAHLLCKDPALPNDSYDTQNDGVDETFLVKAKDSTATLPYGDLVIYSYEGQQSGLLKDIIWYNSTVWFAKKEVYALNTFTGLNHVDTRLEIVDIVY